MVLQKLDAAHELRVPQRKAETPPGHPVALRHAEQLDADAARTLDGEKALRPPSVEDEVAVREVVQNPCLASLGPPDCFLEETIRHCRRCGVGREIQVHRIRLDVEAGEGHVFGTCERDGGEVVRIAGVGKHDRAPALDRAERELHQAGLRPWENRHLAVGVELHAVHLAVSGRDRLFPRGHSRERRIAMDVVPLGALHQRSDDVLGGPDLRIAAAEIDERLAALQRSSRDSREQGGEVLVRQPMDSIRDLAHATMLWNARSRGALSALWRGQRGAFPLLSLVRVASAHEDRRVLLAAPARCRQGATCFAIYTSTTAIYTLPLTT